MQKSRGPVLILPETRPERCDQLAQKLNEYKQRVESIDRRLKSCMSDSLKYMAPEVLSDNFGHMPYSIYILEHLFEEKTVETWALSRKLAEKMDKEGKIYMVKYFEKACKIIADYIETGGKNLCGGTGLTKHAK